MKAKPPGWAFDALIVIACFHASREPSRWQKRT